ncbi:IDEAL domain-containing protein [Bacillus ndiopicus]|uniref:IDEAL domain-containing protein n=1 Tax=Bacillus ndiopicus TaxID=1347368 RepID=UPI0005A92521|nr:IDEAL domain-containing protein [Bacillus ndiopicus]
MDKFYSYTEFLRTVGQQGIKNQCEQLLSDIYLDLFLSRLQRLQRIEKLKELIDVALDERNEQDFYLYTNELCELEEQPNEESIAFM